MKNKINREIKFRAKNGSGWWRYGNLIDCGCFQSIVPVEDMGKVPLDQLGALVAVNAVHGDTIGQYTGMTDENGVEIYEGDIIRCFHEVTDFSMKTYTIEEYGVPMPVIFDEDHAQFMAEDKGCEKLFDIFIDFEYVEVVGNIYDNKDLLKEGI